jgi:hypothetical protein
MTSTTFSPVNIASNRSVLQQYFLHLLINIVCALLQRGVVVDVSRAARSEF